MPEDVFHHHDRVVDQHADAHDQTKQRESIERLALRPDNAAGHDQREGNATDRHQRGGDTPQESEEDQGSQNGAEDSREGQVLEGLADLLALAEPDQEVDALEFRIVVHAGDRSFQFVADFNRVGPGLLGYSDTDGEIPVEMAPVFQRRFLVDHVRDVGQAQTVGTQGQVADLVDIAEGSDGAQGPAGILRSDLAQGLIKITGSQDAGNIPDVDAVQLEVRHPQVDPDFPGIHPVQTDLGDAGHPFQGPDDLSLQQIVAFTEIPRRAEASLEHGLVRVARIPIGRDLDVPDVLRQFPPNPVDALPHLDPGQMHVHVPGEIQPDAPAVAAAAGPHALQSAHAADGVFDRTDDHALHLFG